MNFETIKDLKGMRRANGTKGLYLINEYLPGRFCLTLSPWNKTLSASSGLGVFDTVEQAVEHAIFVEAN